MHLTRLTTVKPTLILSFISLLAAILLPGSLVWGQVSPIDPILMKKEPKQSRTTLPLSGMSDYVLSHSGYEQLLSTEDFIKLQDITQHWWRYQTGAQHRDRIQRTRRLRPFK